MTKIPAHELAKFAEFILHQRATVPPFCPEALARDHLARSLPLFLSPDVATFLVSASVAELWLAVEWASSIARDEARMRSLRSITIGWR